MTKVVCVNLSSYTIAPSFYNQYPLDMWLTHKRSAAKSSVLGEESSPKRRHTTASLQTKGSACKSWPQTSIPSSTFAASLLLVKTWALFSTRVNSSVAFDKRLGTTFLRQRKHSDAWYKKLCDRNIKRPFSLVLKTDLPKYMTLSTQLQLSVCQ